MTLDAARKIVFDAKPVFAELYLKYKDRKWTDYVNENYPSTFTKNAQFSELVGAVSKSLTPLLDATKIDTAIKTLQSTGFVSTADHSGILCHPFFSNSALVRSKIKNQSVISFTCGGVSLTNSSYPRGFFFHDRDLKEIKIPLISLRERRRSVYGLSAFKKERLIQIKDSISHFNITEGAQKKLRAFIHSILECEKVFECEKYSDQLTIINDLLWQNIFGNDRGNLIYIEAENIVRQLLLDFHLDQITPIHKILFDQTLRENYVSNFEQVVGAHSTTTRSGSHIFWYIDEKSRTRVQIFLKNSRLESTDGKVQIDLNPDSLRIHLTNYTLIPCMALCYGVLAGYYGLILGGGFSQIKYLGDILKSWQKTMEVSHDKSQAPRTDLFSGEFVLAGISNAADTKPASLFDILLYSTDPDTDYLVRQATPDEQVDQSIDEMTVGETIDAMMDELVEIIIGVRPVIEGVKIHKTFHV